jgi:7-cyano-7-deazaguanine synthase
VYALKTDLILLSGGLDSTTLLASRVDTVGLAVSVDYGQRHARELVAARRVAEYYGISDVIVDLTSWGALLSGSSLTDDTVPVPHGHYEHESMRATVVPNRNAILLMAAAGVAMSHNLTTVLTAVHSGDHAIYPDCRPEFIAAISHAVSLGTDGEVAIEAPFADITKTDIARLACQLEVPVALTWSCYEGGTVHCGRCGTCYERREAFTETGLTDPTIYEGGMLRALLD